MESSETNATEVTIYTDGACIGNPGPGGYGVILLAGPHRRELSGGFRLTTNNRMEMTAAIVAVEALKTRCTVTLHSDSQLLVNCFMNGAVRRWQSKGWMRSRTEKVQNADLWQRLLELCDGHELEMKWLRGHAGQSENERADQLATEAARGSDLPADVAYEQGRTHLDAGGLFAPPDDPPAT